MRKFILTFAACVCMVILSHAQECEVISYKALDMMYPAMQIDLFKGRGLDLSKVSLINPPVKNLSLNKHYSAYIAPSDSAIMVFLFDNQISFFQLCFSKTECDSLIGTLYIEDLIIEEFNRLQPAGVFQGSAAEADSTIHYIVQKIKDMYGGSFPPDKKFPFSNAVYTLMRNANGEFTEYAGKINPVSSLCIYNNYNVCSLIDTVRQCGADFVKGSTTALKSPVQHETLSGTKFQAFDMNGNFIRSGSWRENSADKFRTPAIIRFENGFTVQLNPPKRH